MEKAHELFPGLAKRVREAHEERGLISSHGVDHDLRAANYALMIAPDARTARLAAAAGLCHSADHMVEKLVRELLQGDLTEDERDEVVLAVLRHESVNSESDTPVEVTLKDADRLANLDADVIARSGQFHPDLLVVDPIHLENDPEATYHDPRSLLWDVANCVSWTEETGPYVLRLPKARALGASRAAFLRFYISTIHAQREEAGLIPYPEL